MPYIKLEDRTRFSETIKETLAVLNNGPENPYVKGEILRVLCEPFVSQVSWGSEGVDNSFNSIHFDATKKKTLVASADSLSTIINRSDPINSAGDLNYCISAVMWGFMGAATGSTAARYGMRAYLKGILEAIIQELKSSNQGNQADITQSFRRNLITRGVLSDVIDEAYRRDTAAYENRKKAENGDIWKNGELVLTLTEGE